ncbi:MAG: RNA polymerase sigma factor [Elusimicrobia bacterium]|nr:RNA polymerase sigma factor [Elusimicrobiota bacterium]
MPDSTYEGETPAKASEPDETLMARFRDGAEEGFQAVFNRYSAHVINFIYRFLKSQEESEDLAQEVFLRIYRAKERYDPSRPFRPWLFSIASRLVSNRLRDRKRHPHDSIDQRTEMESGESLPRQIPDSPADRPAELIEKKTIALTVQKALDALPETQRMAVLLARFQGMSHEEIAVSLATSVSAVKSLLFRSRQTLKEALGPYVQSDSIPEK